MNNTRPGLRTTEFWLALAVTVGGIVATIYAETELGQVAGAIAAALASAGYGFARSGVKRVEAAAASGAAERADLIRLEAARRGAK